MRHGHEFNVGLYKKGERSTLRFSWPTSSSFAPERIRSKRTGSFQWLLADERHSELPGPGRVVYRDGNRLKYQTSLLPGEDYGVATFPVVPCTFEVAHDRRSAVVIVVDGALKVPPGKTSQPRPSPGDAQDNRDRKQLLSPWSEFEPLWNQLLSSTGATHAEVMRLIGYSGGSPSSWRNNGGAPTCALNAARWAVHSLGMQVPAAPAQPILTIDQLSVMFDLVVKSRSVPDAERRDLIRILAQAIAQA